MSYVTKWVKCLSHVWFCDPMDCSLPGSSVHGIFQARVLEWVAISFSRRSSPPRDWTWVSHVVGRHFTVWATREVSYVTKTKQCRKKNGLFFSPPWKPWIPSSLRAPDSLSTYLRINSLTTTKSGLFQGCKDSSIYANQSMRNTILTNRKIKNIWSS